MTGLARQIVLVQCLSDKGFNDRLSTDVEFSCCRIEFVQHLLAKVDVDPLDRWHHPARVRKILRYIFSPFGELGDDFSRNGFGDLRVVFIQCSFLLRRFPECDEVIVFSCCIFPHFKNNSIELSANPADSSILFRVVVALIDVVRMRPDLLHVFEANTAARVPS